MTFYAHENETSPFGWPTLARSGLGWSSYGPHKVCAWSCPVFGGCFASYGFPLLVCDMFCVG